MKEAWNIIKKILGILLITLGIISLFLPFFQGILLIILGLALLENNKIKDYIPKLIRKKKKTNKKQDSDKKYIFLFLRYLILLGLVFSLPLIYKVLTPLTVYSTGYLLKLFYNISINEDIITLPGAIIQIIPACVAGSAYLLLLILNLSMPLKPIKRICSILFSFILFFILNILRIFILTVLLVNKFKFFDFTHKLFWYVLSTLIVIGIWFLTIKIFSIKEIPIYTDMKDLIKQINK